ncbi:hypothetical protein L1887_36853 [Cichorium endivia]|nr:hypothetical protein L1887_36853 [Cichorium endivia]
MRIQLKFWTTTRELALGLGLEQSMPNITKMKQGPPHQAKHQEARGRVWPTTQHTPNSNDFALKRLKKSIKEFSKKFGRLRSSHHVQGSILQLNEDFQKRIN